MQDLWRSVAVLIGLVVCLLLGFTVMRAVLLPDGARPLPSLGTGARPPATPTSTPRTAAPTEELPSEEPTSEEPTPDESDEPPATATPLEPSPTPVTTPAPTVTPVPPITTTTPSSDPVDPTITPVPPIVTATPSADPTPGEDGEIVRVFPDLQLDGDTLTSTRLTFEFSSEGPQRVSAGVSGGGTVEVSLFVGNPPGTPETDCYDLRTSSVRASVTRDRKWTVTVVGADGPTTTDLTIRFRSSDPTVNMSRTLNIPNGC